MKHSIILFKFGISCHKFWVELWDFRPLIIIFYLYKSFIRKIAHFWWHNTSANEKILSTGIEEAIRLKKSLAIFHKFGNINQWFIHELQMSACRETLSICEYSLILISQPTATWGYSQFKSKPNFLIFENSFFVTYILSTFFKYCFLKIFLNPKKLLSVIFFPKRYVKILYFESRIRKQNNTLDPICFSIVFDNFRLCSGQSINLFFINCSSIFFSIQFKAKVLNFI